MGARVTYLRLQLWHCASLNELFLCTKFDLEISLEFYARFLGLCAHSASRPKPGRLCRSTHRRSTRKPEYSILFKSRLVLFKFVKYQKVKYTNKAFEE